MHHSLGKFSSLAQIRIALSDEFENSVPDENTNYNIGYFEGRHQTKRWLASVEDLKAMYTRFAPGNEIFLWCDGRESDADREDSQGIGTKRKKPSDSTMTKRQAREEELDSIFKQLKEKHADAYTDPQLRLWARMIVNGTHGNLVDPPHVPMIMGAPLPKKQKQDSITTAIVGAATAFAKAISPSPPQIDGRVTTVVGVSPGKTAEVRMKNLEQLRYIQQLMEDGILSQEEFVEQKKIILDTLRVLRST